MGSTNSKEELVYQVSKLLEQQGMAVKQRTIEAFLGTVVSASPWFLTGGGLNISDWGQVKRDLQKRLQREGTDSFPTSIFSLLRLGHDALHTDKVKVRQEVAAAKEILEEIQEEETRRSLRSAEGFQGDRKSDMVERTSEPNDSLGLTPKSVRLRAIPQTHLDSDSEGSPTSSTEESLFDEEEQLTQEIKALQKKLQHCKAKNTPITTTPSVPPAYSEDWGQGVTHWGINNNWEIGDEKRRQGGIQFWPRHTVAPVIEVPDPNNPGQALRQHVALSFKEMKQLKEAVSAYGAQVPFTLAIVESFTVLNLTPSDWQQLCRAVLSGGDYLLWRGEYQENCVHTARLNAQAGQAQRNLDMLTGARAYADLANQIVFDPAVYLQVVAAATKAWKALPNKASGDQLSKFLQGPSEPFQDYVDRLLQLAGKLFGNVATAMPIVKQLAYENANKYCKEALRSHRAKSLNEYIRICRDIDGHFIQGQVIAAALRPGHGPRATGNKTCFNCGASGHFKRERPQLAQGTTTRPGRCPRCRKGAHWANNCRSKTDIDGRPLPSQDQQQGNGWRASLQGPRTSVYGAMTPGIRGTYSGSGRIQFIPQGNPFALQTSPAPPQEAQDWTSVPPPEQS
ncbi:PREDICTED: endogenous retrovirus group K member 5 Gag polyprotein-like [Condylura cristata]|uniref:endogenous retrovirus group K member 5 Gag polyprotein-like n=1 Tax=Condylura cristata TaxID=143302 RepID=UPI000642FCDC|nr:PREDICTED: endogenous retrovirus group K member 5 Gag polyprotein-like [Condylura cristata]